MINTKLKNHKPTVNESFEIFVYQMKVGYNEEENGWYIKQNVWLENDFYHYSTHKDRFISDNTYGRTFEIHPTVKEINHEYIISIGLRENPSPEEFKKCFERCIEKLRKVILVKKEADKISEKEANSILSVLNKIA